MIYAADTVTGVQQAAAESTASPGSTSIEVSRVRPTFIAHRTDDEDSEVACGEHEAFLQILADFSHQCMVHFEGAAFLASKRKQLLKQELRHRLAGSVSMHCTMRWDRPHGELRGTMYSWYSLAENGHLHTGRLRRGMTTAR